MLQKLLQLVISWLLKFLKQPWTDQLYNGLAKHLALTAVETVFLQERENGLHILLTKRPDNDRCYPRQWHSPGTMLRTTDWKGWAAAFKRVSKEIGADFSAKPVTSFPHSTPRGTENAAIFLCNLNGEPTNGFWWPIDELPGDLIEHHHAIVETAVQLYHQPDPAEIIRVCEWLANQQFVAPELFPARLKAGFGLNASCELISAVLHDNRWHILLSQRPANDPDYPEQWCTSGKIKLKGVPNQELFKRLALPDETGLLIGDIRFAGLVEVTNEPRGSGKVLRGHWLCLVFVQILPIMPDAGTYTGQFVPVDQLPRELVWGHEYGILPAAKGFLETGKPGYLEVRHPD